MGTALGKGGYDNMEFKTKLHQAATLYYEALSSEEKLALQEIYRELDKDGNGVISQEEIVNAFEVSPRPKMAASVGAAFSLLDKDGNGTLDLQECKALFFISSAYPTCDHCYTFIFDNFIFTCQDCWKLGESSYDLCLNCYPAKATFHTPHHVFGPRNIVLNELAGQAQCVTCGDYHVKGSSGYLKGTNATHMVRREDGFVCEWCCTWLCSKCGAFFLDITGASPRQWLIKTFFCKPCGRAGTKTGYDAIIKDMNKSDTIQACSTCKIKAKNGTLWETTPSTSNTPSMEVSQRVGTTSSLIKAMNVATTATDLGTSIATAVQIGMSCSIM